MQFSALLSRLYIIPGKCYYAIFIAYLRSSECVRWDWNRLWTGYLCSDESAAGAPEDVGVCPWDHCERSKWVLPLGCLFASVSEVTCELGIFELVPMFLPLGRLRCECRRLSLRSLWTFQVSLPLGCLSASVSEITCELGIVEFRCFCRWGACDASAGVCPWDHCERSKWVCRWGTCESSRVPVPEIITCELPGQPILNRFGIEYPREPPRIFSPSSYYYASLYLPVLSRIKIQKVIFQHNCSAAAKEWMTISKPKKILRDTFKNKKVMDLGFFSKREEFA